MIFLIVFLICIFTALAFMGMAAVSDVRRMLIPNSYSLYIILSFIACYAILFLGSVHENVFEPILSHIISAGLAFVLTFILFALKVLGAGDSKLATACALWMGAVHLITFLFFMTLCGAALSLFALYVKKKKPFQNPKEGSWISQVQAGKEKVPYGVAIAFGTLVAFAYAEYFSADVLSSFLAK